MSSRFVSGGTNEEPTERDEAWLEAQQKIEATRQQKAEIGKQADGKSLYETLQANKVRIFLKTKNSSDRASHLIEKAAKQDAFEESIRLKNQFRSLDEDEVEFLDSVLAETRQREAAVQRETSDQLEAFRRRREVAEKENLRLQRELESGLQGEGLGGASVDGNASAETATAAAESWGVTAGSRKRRKPREGFVGGVKIRRMSSSSSSAAAIAAGAASSSSNVISKEASAVPKTDLHGTDKEAKKPLESTKQQQPVSDVTSKSTESKTPMPAEKEKTTTETKSPSLSPPPPPATVGLGLGAYSSDEDD